MPAPQGRLALLQRNLAMRRQGFISRSRHGLHLPHAERITAADSLRAAARGIAGGSTPFRKAACRALANFSFRVAVS
jgi:hypothetical protein